ncbi:hypothetical protein ACLB2K_035435 [Fragaria x ananassa]
MNAREEGFLLSQVAPAMAAGGGSSGDGTPRTAGASRSDFSFPAVLGRLPPVQEGRGDDCRPFGTVRRPAVAERRRTVGLKFRQGESSGRKREEKERESGLLTPLTRSTPLKPKSTNKTPQK